MNDSWKNMFIDNHPRKQDYTSAMSLLAHLNVDELREVLNDERKFEELIKDVKELKTVEAEKEILIASNRSLAEFNLSQEPILMKGRQAILELSEKGEEYSQNIEKKMNELNSRSGGRSLETAFALLQMAAAEIEEESDEGSSYIIMPRSRSTSEITHSP
ncbi:uncharacterized protein LOC111057516 isoform X3 [Nilaparvata lugens]|uniref:uncharacterized protein LOC111057516 isoform X3 n=1 Tax=Nilaparvata lugens TaxID=108931 RepID=UPI00193CEBE2|nr:uncharacterized protein LOC111057516 isoform X3 [Nilaparvata lugens]XP_039299255.1 uncharacterized protein LOC111057516 isoform X3 [Nilaparvata lugens]XP_039299256.1 uncharacterized protein LOC111057516 isoform X3 [Nilaparvata lugens]